MPDRSSQLMQTTVSEEGSSHLIDDGRAEAQRQIVEMLDHITHLRSCDRQVEELQSVDGRDLQVDVLQNVGGHDFHDQATSQNIEEQIFQSTT